MIDLDSKYILDACCGGRHWWFDKNHPNAVYLDIRSEPKGTISLQPNWSVEPDIISSWENTPFDDESFHLIAWDIPHKLKPDKGLITKKYGSLGEDWKPLIQNGFNELMRVLKVNGTLILKHNDLDIKVSELMEVIGQDPLFGTKTKKGVNNTFFFVFMKLQADIP